MQPLDCRALYLATYVSSGSNGNEDGELAELVCVHVYCVLLVLFTGSKPPSRSPPVYESHWENTFITKTRATSDYLLEPE